jgi:hypothetical protein
LPIINMSSAFALALFGPGAFSLDRAFGIRVPKALAALAALGVAGGVVVAETRPKPAPAASTGGDVQEKKGEDGEQASPS